MAIRPQQPVGVDLILGNDLAGGKVFPAPVVVDNPAGSVFDDTQSDLSSQFPTVFPACVVTRTESHMFEDMVGPFRNICGSTCCNCRVYVS